MDGHPAGGSPERSEQIRVYGLVMKRIAILTLIAVVGLEVPARAQAPCSEVIRLRNEASASWKLAMGAPPSERCEELYRASLAAEATLSYANSNRESCRISDRLQNELKGYHRQAVQARNNACAGRPLRPFPPDIIQR
jgi:hypothetical protein